MPYKNPDQVRKYAREYMRKQRREKPEINRRATKKYRDLRSKRSR